LRQRRYTLASLASNHVTLTGLSPLFPTNHSLIFATSAIAIPLARADDEALWRANQRANANERLLQLSSTNNNNNDNSGSDVGPTKDNNDNGITQIRSRALALEMDGQLQAAMDLYRTFKLTDQQMRLQATIDAIQRTI
jgi:hypothetical protein